MSRLCVLVRCVGGWCLSEVKKIARHMSLVVFCSQPTPDWRFHAGMNQQWKPRSTSPWLCRKTESLFPTWWASHTSCKFAVLTDWTDNLFLIVSQVMLFCSAVFSFTQVYLPVLWFLPTLIYSSCFLQHGFTGHITVSVQHLFNKSLHMLVAIIFWIQEIVFRWCSFKIKVIVLPFLYFFL